MKKRRGVEVDLRQGFFGKGEEWPWECEPGYVEKSWRVSLTGSGMGLKPNGTKSPKNDAFTDAPWILVNGRIFSSCSFYFFTYRNLKLIDNQVYQSLLFDFWFLKYT